jgi:hypothetical protein
MREKIKSVDIGAACATWFALLELAVLLGGISVLLHGCGGSTPREQHTALNRITAVADPTYATAVESCDAARDAIIARQGTSYEEDRRAMYEIHRVCDAMVAGFESLRGSQLTARAAIDSGADAAVAGAIREALALWAELQSMIPELDELGTGGE